MVCAAGTLPGAARGYGHGVGGCVVSGPRLDCRCDPSSHHAPNSPGDGARNMAHDTHLPISPHLATMQMSLCVWPGPVDMAAIRFGSFRMMGCRGRFGWSL